MLKFLVLVALILAGLVYAKEARVFEEAGIVSSCHVTRAPLGSDGEWWACQEGILTGFPTLSRDRDTCSRQRRVGKYEYWRCNIPLGEVRVGG